MNADELQAGREDEFADWVYRNERVELFHSATATRPTHTSGEGEGDFRARLAMRAREVPATRRSRNFGRSTKSKLRTKEDQLERAEMAIEKEEGRGQQRHLASRSLGAGRVTWAACSGSGRKSRSERRDAADRGPTSSAATWSAPRKRPGPSPGGPRGTGSGTAAARSRSSKRSYDPEQVALETLSA